MWSLLIWNAIPAIVTAVAVPRGTGLEVLEKRLACPRDLPAAGSFEYPHLVLPISKSNAASTYPNTYFPNITPNDIATVFNFDILGNGQNCELGFYFPRPDQLTTSSFTFSGPGTFVFSVSMPGTGGAEGATAWNHQPPAANNNGFPKTLNMQPGNYYRLSVGACAPGLASLTISSPDTCFTWFQDFNPCAIGPFITYG